MPQSNQTLSPPSPPWKRGLHKRGLSGGHIAVIVIFGVIGGLALIALLERCIKVRYPIQSDSSVYGDGGCLSPGVVTLWTAHATATGSGWGAQESEWSSRVVWMEPSMHRTEHAYLAPKLISEWAVPNLSESGETCTSDSTVPGCTTTTSLSCSALALLVVIVPPSLAQCQTQLELDMGRTAQTQGLPRVQTYKAATAAHRLLLHRPLCP